MPEIERFISYLQQFHSATLSSENPMDKTLTTALVVETLLAQGQHVDYLDLDLQFTSIASVYKIQGSDSTDLDVYHCRENELIDSILSLSSVKSYPKKKGAVFVDSLNTLQLLLREQDKMTDSRKANHEAGVLLTFLQEYAARNSRILVTTNIIRARPKVTEGSNLWERELAGGRLIRSKSEAIFKVTRGSDSFPQHGNILKVDLVTQHYARDSAEGASFYLDARNFTLR